MKTYIELHEIGTILSAECDLIRVDVTAWNENDISALINELRVFAVANYSFFMLNEHLCRHDIGGACEVRIL